MKQFAGLLLILFVSSAFSAVTLEELTFSFCEEHPNNYLCVPPIVDGDGDGILDDIDACPGSVLAPGDVVDAAGCIVPPVVVVPPVGDINPALSGMLPGELKKLNDLSCSGPESDCNNWTDYGGFVCEGLICYGTGGGHSTTMNDALYKLDLSDASSLGWDELYEPTPCAEMTEANYSKVNRSWTHNGFERPISTHSYNHLIIKDDKLIHVGARGAVGKCLPSQFSTWVAESNESTITKWDIETSQWEFGSTLAGQMPISYQAGYIGTAKDALTNEVYFYSAVGLIHYDTDTEIKTRIKSGGLGLENDLMYSASDSTPETAVFYAVSQVWANPIPDIRRIELNRAANTATFATITQNNASKRHTSKSQHWGFVWDDVNGVLARIQDGEHQTFDPDAGLWEYTAVTEQLSAHFWAAQLVSDEFYIFISDKETWAYRLP